MQSVTSKGPDSQETSSDQIDGHGGSDSKLNGQQSNVHTPSLSNASHKEQVTRSLDHPLEENSNKDDDEILDSATPLNQRGQDFSNPRVCMHDEEPGRQDVNKILTHHKFKALRELSRNQVPQTAGTTSPSPSTEGNQLSDNLILDAPISSNTSSSPSGTDTHASPSSQIPSPKAVLVDSTVLSPRDDKAGGGDAGVTTVSPVVTKAGTNVPQKDGSDFSSENLFEGALTESKEGTPNILQSEAEIIEGFITSLGAREKDVGEESPSAEGHRPGSVSDCPFIHDSGEPSSQEALPIVGSLKWDGTPTQPDMEIPVTSAPLEIARSVGTQGGPATRGTVKKALDLILEEIRQNTLKRRRVTKKTVLDEEASSFPIVDLDYGTPSKSTDKSSKIEKKAHCGGGVSKKGKKPTVVEKSAEGPGAPVVRSKRKHVISKSSKGKRQLLSQWGMMLRHGLLTSGNKRKGGIGGQSTVSSFIEAQQRGTEEIECLTMLVSQKNAEIVVLKASQSSTVPGALLDLQEENAHLKSANASLKKQLEELTQQMICDQRAANERIDKLLAKL
ncbi:hypothetical protein HAX54_048398 [Datura stramonium]|uniref:Uncharacterized protein n=1 Tax=Datura stramonium TaxID=4076 RepID=A0ABS8WL81_DATST|nr:hypothetical protein [Datura stramonium]